MSSIKNEWRLTREALQHLLARLDPDPDRAAAVYEDIRQSLITFFEFRGGLDPAEMADQTIDRVARLLQEGRQIFSSNPASFFLGVARNIAREGLTQYQKVVALDDPAVASSFTTSDSRHRNVNDDALEQGLSCLETCLDSLPAESRELIVRYYQGDKANKIASRKQLATQLGIPLNALRIRACRIRATLEECHTRCMQQKGND